MHLQLTECPKLGRMSLPKIQTKIKFRQNHFIENLIHKCIVPSTKTATSKIYSVKKLH